MENTIDNQRYEHVLEALGVISRLTENKRLCLRHGQIHIDDHNNFQFLFRWWNKDKRKVVLDKVKSIFNEALSMARSSMKDIVLATKKGDLDNEEYLQTQRNMRRYGRLTQELAAATQGMEAQLVTYSGDQGFCALLDVFVESVRENLQDMAMTMQVSRRTNVDSSPVAKVAAAVEQVTSNSPPAPTFSAPTPGNRRDSERMDDTDEDQVEIF